jgi:hypothetical protein
MTKVKNMISNKGNKIANQFDIEDGHKRYFQSYDSIIILIENGCTNELQVTLDEHYWNYSVTTSRYRNQFLDEDSATIKRKIASGEYRLANLN